MHNLSEKEKTKLQKNENVKKITSKNIMFSSIFKIRALDEHARGKSANQIFLDAGIPIELLSSGYAGSTIKIWKRQAASRGIASLETDRRGKFKSTLKGTLKSLTREELEEVITIQKEVIDELKKSKALVKKKF